TDSKALMRGYQDFSGLEHRLERVAEINGVLYINDSKATNDDSAAVALAAVERPVVLLLGGRDKGGGYDRTLRAATRVRVVIAFGEARELIAQAFARHPDVQVCPTFNQAFAQAAARARPGDAVLLAPACSSFDEFKNYAERGRAFKALVRDQQHTAPGEVA
ncbi:MAG: UDP-N-acetylmuramoyl-L-alanine--D-glutamate ligase, partial [Deltaproteobacteria bacterium]|nr:UDP-N-acetylmuramoyl-L-alanine--D-glutamate ligase [Deltaproteobacteria bacterium]